MRRRAAAIKKVLAMALVSVMAMAWVLNPWGRELGAVPPDFSDRGIRGDQETLENQESQMVLQIVSDEEISEDECPDCDVMVETSPVSGIPAQYPPVTANAAVLMDGESGQVCYERQAHSLRPPASTTKIMTAILAIESDQLDSVVTVSDTAASTGEASLHLQKGQKVLLRELVEGALVRSGNDACVAIAEAVSGDVEFFVRNMNRKAAVLGAVNTKFVNPNGLPHEAHLTTPYDLALIARYALRNPIFAQFVNEPYGKFDSVEPRMSVDIRNTNKLLHSYPSADGVKTGTTNAAGKCLVASATKEGRRLICVVLDAPDRYGDCQRLFDWGFANTEKVQMGKAGDLIVTQSVGGVQVPFCLSTDINILVRKGEGEALRFGTEFPNEIASIRKGDVGGHYVVYIGEREVFRCTLLADADAGKKTILKDTIRAKMDSVRKKMDKAGDAVRDGIEELKQKILSRKEEPHAPENSSD